MKARRHALRRWPSRNFLAELEPSFRESSAIDELARRSPELQRLQRRLRRASQPIRARVACHDWVRMADARASLQTAEFELAFNLGFENGIVAARAESLRRSAESPTRAADSEVAAALRATVAGAPFAGGHLVATLLELAWALAWGAPRSFGRQAQRRRPRDRKRPSR